MADYRIRGEEDDIVVRGGLAGSGGRGPKLRLLILGGAIALAYVVLSFFLGPLQGRDVDNPPLQQIFQPDLVAADHVDFEDKCLKCHLPLFGPTNARCVECHEAAGAGTMHEDLPDACWSCHAEHIGDKFIHVEMEDTECLVCHQDIRTREEPTKEMTLKSPLSRQVFSHKSHDEYRCSRCHDAREPTVESTAQENIFTMEACFACHEEDDCQACHLFHEERAGPDDAIRDVPD